eukprot:04102.XXX_99616_91862_1 [CDS] Oithona nana genome sequencing.
MGVNEDDLNNIMGGMEAGGIKVNDQKRKLKNRFEICRKLGQGTYGKVQLGINKETGQQVAIKTIKKSKIETEADLIRIRREIQIMSSVQHPNIIHIYEVFENKEKMVLVMEIAAGGELYDYLSERKCLEENEARRVFRQIACAVYYCHKNNICHRDLKLENILLDENGNAKIADFGLSNVYDGNNLLNTFCGSPLYASPEIVRGNPYAGPEVDCWSLGVLLYTLVYGAMPFDGSNFKRLVKQITTGDYYEPKSPSPASGLVRAMLTVSNEKRANIGDICSHWWVNEGYPQPCLDEAEYLASLTPVRLDLLLSLAPSAREEIIPGQDAQVSIEELPSIPPPIVETIAPPSLPPLSEPVAAPVVAPLAASEPAVIDVKSQEPVEVKKREKEKGKRKLSETPSMVDPDLVTKKPSGRKSTTPVPTTPPPIPMETNDTAVYERQVSPHRSGRSTPKANRKRREGAKTPVPEANNDQNNQPPLVPEMTPEIQRKPPAPKAKSKVEDEAEVAKPMKRRLSRKERNVKTPDPNFEGGDHTKHIPAERPMTPRQARAPSPEERPLVQLESTVTPDKIDVINYDQPVDEVQPLEIALPSLAQAKEGVRNSGLFNSVIQVNVPPVTAVQPEVKKPELIEVKNLPVATKKEATPSPSTSLIRQEQAQDLNEGHQAKQPLKKEVIDNQINERADSSKQIERIAHEGQGQQKVGSLPVQDSEQEKRPKPSETMSQGKAADNQMNLFSAKQELASQKTTNDVMYPVSAEVDKSLPDVNGTASKTDENRALINSLPKPFQANNIPNDEEPVSENSREISRVEKAQEPLHIETQPTPSIHQLSLDHTPESTLPSPQSVPVTPPSSDSPQNVPKYHLLQRPEKRDNRDSKVIKAAAYWNTYIGEVLDKKKPIPDNVKSLEKPKKIVTAGVGPKGYNDLKTAFESKTSTPKQEEPSINVSPSSTAVGGMQRRNSRKIPIEGCSPGLKVTDAKSVFETKHQQPQTPVVYRRNSSSTGDSIGKGKESDEFQTRGPNYVKKKVPEFPPPPIAKTPFGSNRRAGALSPQTIQPKDEKLSLQNGVPEDESKSKPKSVARTADSLLKETSEQKPEVKTVDQNGKTSSLHNTTTAAVNERLQPKPSESQNGVKKDEQLSEQKAKSVKSFVSQKQEPVSSTKPSPKPVSNDVIPSSTSTVPAFVDNKHSSKIRTVNEAPSIPVKPVIDIKSKHIAKAMPSTDTNGTVKEVIKVKCEVAENDKVSGPKKVESVKKQLPEKPTAVSKDEGQSKPSKNEPKISAPVEQELPKPVPKSSEDKQLRNEVKAAENVGNHRIIPIQIQQSPAEARVPVQNASNSDLKIPIQTESTSEMKIPIHTLKSEDSHKAESRPEATKIPIQTEPISSRVPIQIESNETFSRQESVRSPVSQEHHIPIHVEGKGTILNKVSSTASGLDGDSLEGRDNFSTNSLSRRRFGSRKKRSSYAYSDSSNSSNLGAVEPSQEEVYDASSGGLQKYTSIGKHGIEPMFRLRKTRPPFAAQRSDSFSSGEEEFEDEYFRETTAENLFSTLLTRVKSLTRRINDEDDQLRHQNHKIINHRLNPGGTHGFLERTALRSSLKRTPSSTQSALSRQSSMDTSGMRASFRDDPSYEVGGYDDGTSSVRSYGSSAMDRDVGGYGRSSIHRGTTIKDDQIDGSLYKGGGDLSSSVSVTSKQRLRPAGLDLDDDRSLASTSSGYVSQPQHHHLPAKVEGSRLRSYNNQEGQLQTNKPLTLEKESSKPSTISTASFTASNSSSVASNINVGPSNPMPEPMPISVASSVQDSMSKLPSPPVNLPTQLSVPISKPKPTIKSPPKLYLPRVTQSPPRVSSPPVPVTQVSSPAPKTAPPTQPMTIPPFSQIQSVPQKSQLSSPPPKSTPPQYAPPSLPSDEPIPESVIKPVASSQHDSAPKVKSPVLTQPLYTPFRRSSISEGDSNSATSPPGTASSIIALTQDRLHRNSNAQFQKDPNSEGEMGVDNGKGSNSSRRIILPYGGAKSDGLLNKHAFISCNVIAAAERRKRDSYSRSSTTELPLEKV